MFPVSVSGCHGLGVPIHQIAPNHDFFSKISINTKNQVFLRIFTLQQLKTNCSGEYGQFHSRSIVVEIS